MHYVHGSGIITVKSVHGWDLEETFKGTIQWPRDLFNLNTSDSEIMSREQSDCIIYRGLNWILRTCAEPIGWFL